MRDRGGRTAKQTMSVLTRIRISSFLAGVAVAGVFGVYQLRHDLDDTRVALSKEVRKGAK